MEVKTQNYNYDLGNLILYDTNALTKDFSKIDEKFNEHYDQLTKNNIKRFLQNLYTLKNMKDDEEEAIPDEYRVIDYAQSRFDVNLPAGTTEFPRHKKIPE